MPRRVAHYLPGRGWEGLNRISTIGAFLLGASVLPFLWNAWRSQRGHGPVAGDNPWGGHTLEWATSSPPPVHNFDGPLPTIMTGHVLLGMVAPLLLGLGAPVTLALQSTTRPAKRRLLRVLHSSPARILAHPVVGFTVFGTTLLGLYLSPLFPLSLRNPVFDAAVHVHFLAAGCLFLWPLLGADPLPRALPHGGRLLTVLTAVPFHAFLGVALLSTRSPLAPAVYPSLRDQHAAAGLLWASGEVMTVVTAAIILRAWMAADGREAARFDRQLDGIEMA